MSMQNESQFINTQAGVVEVKTKEQAIGMVVATALHEGLTTREELKDYTPIREIAEKFDINLSHFKRIVSTDLGQHHMGFGPNELRYTEGDYGFEYSPTIVVLQVPDYSREKENHEDNMVLVTESLKEVIPALGGAKVVSLSDEDSTPVVFEKIASATNDNELTVVIVEDHDDAVYVERIISLDLVPNYYAASLITMFYEEQLNSLEVKVTKSQNFTNTLFTNEVEKLGGHVPLALD